MPHQIDVDGEVFAALQERAEPFIDTPNTVLRRLLELEPESGEMGSTEPDDATPAPKASGTPRPRPKPKRKPTKAAGGRTRAPAGSLLPESEYERPMLESLLELGGSAPSREVVAKVGEKLHSRLTELDRSALASGGIRWENRLQFVRLRLIDQGLMIKETGRGIWAISDAGRERVTSREKS